MYISDLVSYKRIIDENIEYNTVNMIDSNGNNLLHYVCSHYNNDIDSISKLIENNIDINKQNKYGLTPLHCLLKNSNINLLNQKIKSDKSKIVKLLLEHGANPSLRTKHKFNSLHLACIYSGNKDIIKLLLDAGSNPNELCNFNNSPLLLLCRYHGYNKESVKLLVENGADINHNNSCSISCLYTLYNDNLSIKDDYVDYIKVFKYLLDNGASPNHVIDIDDYSGTILHYMLEDLILLDLDPSDHSKYSDNNKRYNVFCNLIELTMKYNADPNIKNSDNNTLLDILYDGSLSFCSGSGSDWSNNIEDYDHLIDIIEHFGGNHSSGGNSTINKIFSYFNLFDCLSPTSKDIDNTRLSSISINDSDDSDGDDKSVRYEPLNMIS